MHKKVITVVLNSFQNDSRVLKEAVSLYNNGFNVEVVALHQAPLKVREKIKNVSVNRIQLKSRNWPKSKPVQLLKYLEFVYRVVKKYRHVDIVHCNDLYTLPIGVLIKKLSKKQARIVYDAHEYEINDRPNQSRSSIRRTYLLEKFLIKYADKTITVSQSIAKAYKKLYGIETPAVVLNAPPYRSLGKRNIFREKFNINKQQTIFLYQGGLSQGRGVDILLETFARASAEKVLVIMGFGPLQHLVEDACKFYRNIFFQEAVAPDVLLDYTSSADFGILFYENNCKNHYYCSPNKLFEYLMAGIPVIVSNLYELKRMVTRLEIGIVAGDNTVNGLEKAVDDAFRADSALLRINIERIRSVYSWEQQERNFLETYTDLTSCVVSAE